LYPFALVIVSIHSDYRCKGIEFLKYVRSADIAGMDNEINAFENLKSFRAEQTMGVGDDSNTDFCRPGGVHSHFLPPIEVSFLL
jgi:hypothetical protein